MTEPEEAPLSCPILSTLKSAVFFKLTAFVNDLLSSWSCSCKVYSCSPVQDYPQYSLVFLQVMIE